MLEMRGQNLLVGPVEHGLGGHDLGGDVDAVAVLLHHLDDAVHLSPGGL